jgi:hypothetical protein
MVRLLPSLPRRSERWRPTPAAKLALEPPAAMDAYAARESGILPYVDASRAQRYRSILHWALSVARAAAGIHAVEAVRRSLSRTRGLLTRAAPSSHQNEGSR